MSKTVIMSPRINISFILDLLTKIDHYDYFHSLLIIEVLLHPNMLFDKIVLNGKASIEAFIHI
jgi:hypothetical protein